MSESFESMSAGEEPPKKKLSIGAILQILLRVLPLILLAVWFFMPSKFGEKLTFGGGKEEVYYKDGATKEDAQRLGDALEKIGFFNGQSEKSVQLTKPNGTFTVRFVIDKLALVGSDTKDAFLLVGETLSTMSFEGKPITIDLCDDSFKTQTTMTATP